MSVRAIRTSPISCRGYAEKRTYLGSVRGRSDDRAADVQTTASSWRSSRPQAKLDPDPLDMWEYARLLSPQRSVDAGGYEPIAIDRIRRFYWDPGAPTLDTILWPAVFALGGFR